MWVAVPLVVVWTHKDKLRDLLAFFFLDAEACAAREDAQRERAEGRLSGMVRHNADGSRRPHQGWDLEAEAGTPCFAVADGTIELLREAGAYGRQIVLRFDFDFDGDGRTDRLFAVYCHMQRLDVIEGQPVKRGDQIGLTGNTGNASSMRGPDQHLHFEVRTRPITGTAWPIAICRWFCSGNARLRFRSWGKWDEADYTQRSPNSRLSDRDAWRITAGKWKVATFNWKSAHSKLAQDMMTQRNAARRVDEVNAARVEREQELAIERTTHVCQIQLVGTRGALDRLSDELDRAPSPGDDQSIGCTADLSDGLAARCRAYGATDCDTLLATLPGQLAAAEENTAKLIALQDYVRSLVTIDWRDNG